MSLQNLSEIDLVVRLPGAPARVALVIHDAGEIIDDGPREEALQSKLAAYLAFVASGQFAQAHPELSGYEPRIAVVCVRPPTEGMKQISAIQDTAARPDLIIPVEVTSDADFKAKFR